METRWKPRGGPCQTNFCRESPGNVDMCYLKLKKQDVLTFSTSCGNPIFPETEGHRQESSHETSSELVSRLVKYR